MTHPRRIIREAAKTRLDGATAAETRVWASPEPPVNVESVLIDEGPVILIYTRRDRLADGASYPASGFGSVRRCAELVVEAIIAGGSVVDGGVDDLAEEIEGLLNDFTVPGMPSCEIRHKETDIESTTEFEAPIGSAMLVYEAEYWKEWRKDPDEEGEAFPCDADVGVIVNGGPRQPLPIVCEDCD